LLQVACISIFAPKGTISYENGGLMSTWYAAAHPAIQYMLTRCSTPALENVQTNFIFCAIASQLAIARISYGNSVCLSVRPSVTSRYRSKTRWDRDFGFAPYDSSRSLVFRDKNSCPWVKGAPRTRGRNRGTPLKRRYSAAIGSSNVKMVANRHRHAAYHNKHWRRASKKCQHRCLWMTLNFQNRGFWWIFRDFGLQHAFQGWIAPKWLEIDQNNLRMKFSE